MRTLISRLAALKDAATIVRNPDETEHVFALIHRLAQDPALQKRFEFGPDARRFIEDPFYQSFPDLADLRSGFASDSNPAQLRRLGTQRVIAADLQRLRQAGEDGATVVCGR